MPCIKVVLHRHWTDFSGKLCAEVSLETPADSMWANSIAHDDQVLNEIQMFVQESITGVKTPEHIAVDMCPNCDLRTHAEIPYLLRANPILFLHPEHNNWNGWMDQETYIQGIREQLSNF